jgi:hypothetical protein
MDSRRVALVTVAVANRRPKVARVCRWALWALHTRYAECNRSYSETFSAKVPRT